MPSSSSSSDAIARQLISWLAIDSTSGQEAAFLEELERYFIGHGFRCERQAVVANRWNLLVRTEREPRLVYSTHVDTVPPYLPPREEGERIYGRGACDTKGGIVAMAQAGLRLLEAGHRDLGYLFVVGEEVDHIGAKKASELALRAERIILCEPTLNRVVSAQKGMLKFALSSTGVAGHSAFPERGISAVTKLLDALQALRTATWPTDALLGPTTLNIGVIAGGVAANVFAPSARAELIFRAVSSASELLERVEALCEGLAEVQIPVFNDPVFFDVPPDVATCVVPFNTDATYLQPLGPIWLVGPGDIEHAHSDQEHIAMSSLLEGIALYERLGLAVLSSDRR
ncbi:MAG: M20/M25/M40 family metallo-hydrolase [Bradymonadaceae bacterium]|nr:M20/M25/M40 family metallo-hydrolase [Lujinxingiaceae bacterium]